MRFPNSARLVAFGLLMLSPVLSAPSLAQPSLQVVAPPPAEIACHVMYGGDEEVFIVDPRPEPYEAPLLKAAYAFRIRLTLEPHTPEGRLFKFYTYRHYDEQEVILNEGTYLVPSRSKESARATKAVYGFTGLQRIYEPVIERELLYWCEVRSPIRKNSAPKSKS
jgi:hypothetical protein